MKFILSLLLLVSISAAAEPVKTNKPVVCDKFDLVIEALASAAFQEKPVWFGKDEDSSYSVLTNEKTGTWTIIQFNGKMACILGSGEVHQLVKK